MDCSPPGSSVHGISQARILEWVAFPSTGDLPDPGVKPVSPAAPALQAEPLPLSHQESPLWCMLQFNCYKGNDSKNLPCWCLKCLPLNQWLKNTSSSMKTYESESMQDISQKFLEKQDQQHVSIKSSNTGTNTHNHGGREVMPSTLCKLETQESRRCSLQSWELESRWCRFQP